MNQAMNASDTTIERSPWMRALISRINGLRSRMDPESTALTVASMLGMAGPPAVGALTGHLPEGMVASLAGLTLSGGGADGTVRERLSGLIYDLIAGSLGMFIGSTLARQDMLVFGIPAVAAVAAFFGSISRPLARATIYFILFAVIASSLPVRGSQALGLMILFCLGAAWTAGLYLILVPLFTRFFRKPASTIRRPQYSASQLLRRWRFSLKHLAGWQYVIRITLCLLASEGIDWAWPGHRFYWVGLTVVILVQRNLLEVLTKTVQRAIGTFIGVVLISLILLGGPSQWTVITLIAVFGAARPILRNSNYTAYAAVMTPLVILLLELGREPSWAVVLDRLIATLAGCAISLTLGYIGWSRLVPSGRIPTTDTGAVVDCSH